MQWKYSSLSVFLPKQVFVSHNSITSSSTFFCCNFTKKKPLSCIVAKISFKLRAFCKMITAKSFYFCYFSFSDGFFSLRLLWRIIAIFLKDTIRFIFSVIEDKKYLRLKKIKQQHLWTDWRNQWVSEWVREMCRSKEACRHQFHSKWLILSWGENSKSS